MKRSMVLPLIATVALSVLWPTRASGQGVIAEKGKPKAVIVVAADAGRVEKYAAEELAFFLHFMVGAPVSSAVAGSAEPAPSPVRAGSSSERERSDLSNPVSGSASLKA